MVGGGGGDGKGRRSSSRMNQGGVGIVSNGARRREFAFISAKT